MVGVVVVLVEVVVEYCCIRTSCSRSDGSCSRCTRCSGSRSSSRRNRFVFELVVVEAAPIRNIIAIAIHGT